MSFEQPSGISSKEVTKLFPVNSIGEILVGVRSRRDEKRSCQLDFIGGGRQPADCCAQATGIREGLEEVSLEIDHGDMQYFQTAQSKSGSCWVSYYVVEVTDVFEPEVDKGELEDAFFMPVSEILVNLEHPGQLEMLQAFATEHAIARSQL